MGRVYLTANASDDLDEIADHIALDRPSAAENWLRLTYQLFDLFAAQPGMGEMFSARSAGIVRRFSHGSYVVYFRPMNDGAEILRVLHGARDHDKLV